MAIEKKNIEGEASGGNGGKEDDRPAAKPITVHSHAGYKSDERPRSFETGGRRLTVLQVKQTWREESVRGRHRKTFFRVHAHDGRTYEIALDEGTGEWTLEPLRSQGRG